MMKVSIDFSLYPLTLHWEQFLILCLCQRWNKVAPTATAAAVSCLCGREKKRLFKRRKCEKKANLIAMIISVIEELVKLNTLTIMNLFSQINLNV